MKRLTLKLTLNDRVVFSQNTSTEGDHQTLDYIPGSVLLGWCASQLYNQLEKEKAFKIFHSGNVRFSNGLPITDDSYPCFPIPNNLMQPKHQGGGIDNDKLNAVEISIGRPPLKENETVVQYEAIKNKYFSPKNLKIVEPVTGRQLKNAQPREGSPEGQLYGYSHLEAGQSFVATIEGTEIDDEYWQLIKNCFVGQELFLGRSKAIEYGGSVSAVLLGDYVLWPTNEVHLDEKDELCIWVLSDLAILAHQTGQPTLSPTLKDLFPEKDINGVLNKEKSVVGHRRYAPWNGKLQKRDVERSVITAGSVLYYTLKDRQSFKSAAVGIYQEAGLGRIWVSPDVLSKDLVSITGEKLGSAKTAPVIQNQTTQTEELGMTEETTLLQWMQGRYEDPYLEKLDENIKKSKKDLDEIYGYLVRVNKQDKFPGKTQWSQVAEIVRSSNKLDDLSKNFFDKNEGLCREKTNANTKVTTEWGEHIYLASDGGLNSLSKWLESKLPATTSDESDAKGTALSPSFKSYLTTIADYAKSISSSRVHNEKHREGVLSDD
jgi:CRISPR-associated protein Csx10